jgi:hypothetical protein
MQAEDVLACARWLTQSEAAGKPAAVDMIAVGRLGIPALHAAALQPELFQSVRLTRTLTAWSNVVELGYTRTHLTSLVHGALTTYDLPRLAETLGDKLTVDEPVDAMRRRIER